MQVPPNAYPGQTFHANVNGQLVAVNVPPGVGPGSTLMIQVPVRPMVAVAQPQMQMPPRPAANPAAQGAVAQLKRQQTAAALQPKPQTMVEKAQEDRERLRAAQARTEAANKQAQHKASALGQMEAKRERKQVELAEKKAAHHHHGHAPTHSAAPPRMTNASGEISALWWLNMGI